MMRLTISILLLGTLLATATRATVRVSHDDGPWEQAGWTPEGLPMAGDTVIIATSVVGAPSGTFARLIVRPTGSLVVGAAVLRLGGLLMEGHLELDRSATVDVVGNVANTGTIGGDGTMRVLLDGATVSGSGVFGYLAIASGTGTSVRLGSAITVRSLTMATGTRLLTGAYNLTVNGPYRCPVANGEPGIIGTTGTIRLNGSVYGSARGRLVLGAVPGARISRRPVFPEVSGTLGDTLGSVRVSASRRLLFATLVGNVTVDAGVVLEGGGLANGVENTIVGTLVVEGTLRAVEDRYRWNLKGELVNLGTIERCSMIFTGFRCYVRSDEGTWDPSISITYRGTSGGQLAIQGPLVVSTLTIEPATRLDSNIAVIAGGNTLRVRHRFTSDTAHGCRVVCDVPMRLWGACNGIVDGPVVFEGFWGSDIAGRYGRTGQTVRCAVPKRISAAFTATGTFSSPAFGSIVAAGPITLRGPATFGGALQLQGGVHVAAGGDLILARGISGGGSIGLTGAHAAFNPGGAISDSISLEIGTDSTASAIDLVGSLDANTLVLRPGSTIGYRAGDSLHLRGELRTTVQYAFGFNSAAPAVVLPDSAASAVYPGAISVLRYDGAYVTADTIHIGRGYYVRFGGPTAIAQNGRPINVPRSVPIVGGWNLIGAASVPVAVANVTVSGTTLLSGFLPSLGGGTGVTVLEPGKGYWVNAAGAGTLTLNPAP